MRPILILLLASLPLTGYCTEQDREEDRASLRAIVKDFEEGINKKDMSILLKHVSPNVIVTFYDGTVITSIDEFNAYYEKMMEGPLRIVKDLKTTYTINAPATFYGDTAIGHGKTADNFELMRGLNFTLNGNWSATAVKVDNQWKVASIHFSSNLFDNELLNNVKKTNKLYATGGFTAGVLLLLIVSWFRKKQSA